MLHFEVAMIDDVEPNECAEQAPVRFDNALAEQVAVSRQALLQLIKRFEDASTGNFVRPLTGGEASFVDAVVDVVVNKVGQFFVFARNVVREEIDIFVLGKGVESVVKHAADIVFVIVHDPFGFLVPKDRQVTRPSKFGSVA